MQDPPPVSSLLAELAEFITSLWQTLSSPQVHWRWRPSPSAWSLAEILCHLRDVEREVHFPRFEVLAKIDNPFISGVDADQWAEPRAYFQQDGRGELGQSLSP